VRNFYESHISTSVNNEEDKENNNKKVIIVKKRLELGPGNMLIPRGEYEKQMLKKAIEERTKKSCIN